MPQDVPSPCKAGIDPHEVICLRVQTNAAYRQHCKGLAAAEHRGSEAHARMGALCGLPFRNSCDFMASVLS